MTICGAAASMARASAAASNTSTTTGSAPRARSASTLSAARVVPMTRVPSRTQQWRQSTPNHSARSGQKYLHADLLARGSKLNGALQPLQRLGDLCLARRPPPRAFPFLRRPPLPARARRNSALPSLASTRAMSASAFCISLASRARSAARSMTPLSGSAATSPRTTSCTEPCGALAADEISDTRASRLMNSAQRSRARLRLGRRAGQHQRDRRGDVHLGAHRADGGDQIDHPADLGFGLVVGETFELSATR